MRKTTLFIAMSLDGYIAAKDGSVDWLRGQAQGEDDMSGYHDFIRDIDTVIMGWNTYDQIVTELSPDQWPYQDFNSYVLTHRELSAKENIQFVNQNPCDFLKTMKEADGKGIWICGGPKAAHPLIRENLIDIFHISIIPTILGNGIRLFEETEKEIKLKLKHTKSYNGITDLIYELR